MPIALGIDFEALTQTPAYRALGESPAIDVPIESITHRLLDLFASHDVTATFFVVSTFAEQHPALVRAINEAGHEIGSHSATHPTLTSVSSETLHAEIRDSKRTIQDLLDGAVSGFRAPTCQINDDVYTALASAGYTYSSSVMPSVSIPGFYADQYDFSGPTAVTTPQGDIVELPLAVCPVVRVPVSGAWIRLLGRRYTLQTLTWLLDRDRPILTYSHPWEFAPLQDTQLPLRNRVRTGDWLFDTYSKILQLDVEFCTVSTLIEGDSIKHSYVLDTPEKHA